MSAGKLSSVDVRAAMEACGEVKALVAAGVSPMFCAAPFSPGCTCVVTGTAIVARLGAAHPEQVVGCVLHGPPLLAPEKAELVRLRAEVDAAQMQELEEALFIVIQRYILY